MRNGKEYRPMIGCCCCVREQPEENVAETFERSLATPSDIIDYIWENKHDERDPNCTERDFLRFTPVGKWFINFQIIRPFVLMAMCIFLIVKKDFDVSKLGVMTENNFEFLLYYVLTDAVLCLPMLVIFIKIFCEYLKSNMKSISAFDLF